ncbi:hypothetical protein CKO28_16435 [Rhodovibrio sodomensis]|uniref:Lipocalin-like domain-containing protein n=1 Tax=Rhodovibrio sodomensis TaxID=1088 RepID=A0ABS1DH73_9PROT|nr:hypothetical protein [Rhodovibrio sodomensis]
MQYDGLWLVIKVCKMVEIDSSGKDIYVFEKSLLSSTDRMFMLSSHIPTYDLRMNLKLDRGLENWIFHDPTVTAREYHKEAMEHVEIRKPEANKVTVHIPRWALPGIVSVIEWSEKRADD